MSLKDRLEKIAEQTGCFFDRILDGLEGVSDMVDAYNKRVVGFFKDFYKEPVEAVRNLYYGTLRYFKH